MMMMSLLPLAFLMNSGDDVSPLVQWLLPAGLLLLVLGLFMTMRNRRRRQSTRPTAREQLERSRQTQAMKGDLEELMVEIERLTRRFASQIDTKTAELESLIREADERIVQLRDAAAQASRRRVDEPAGHAAIDAPAVDPLTRQVHELADRGAAPVEIARQLNEHVGKIELILALRKTQ
jgi:hypothetical protein